MTNISIKNLTFAYPGQAALFDNANFELDTSWRLGLLGRNGRGKLPYSNYYKINFLIRVRSTFPCP